MGKFDKLLIRILTGSFDASISFVDLCQLLIKLGFDERIKGDHHIFSKNKIPEIINIQPKGAKAKTYQVKQVRNLIQKYQLKIVNDEQI